MTEPLHGPREPFSSVVVPQMKCFLFPSLEEAPPYLGSPGKKHLCPFLKWAPDVCQHGTLPAPSWEEVHTR